MMESRVTRKCHARFGERDRETHKSQELKVRSVPTLFSPLLANIALHGMEQALKIEYNNRGHLISKRAIVRYADDFVVFCETKEDTEKSQEILNEWLGKRGLNLSKEKTRIIQLCEGFDFLGFNIRH